MSLTTNTLSSIDQPGHDSFIISPNSPYDWRNPQNNNLWQGVNGTNNPCPPGFRVPTNSEWDNERLSWSSNNSFGAYASPLKLTAAGVRSGLNGSSYGVGYMGYYWSNTIDNMDLRYLNFSSIDSQMYSHKSSHGSTVRCLKD